MPIVICMNSLGGRVSVFQSTVLFSFFLLPNTACEHQAKTRVPSRNIMSSTLSNLVAIWGTNRPCQILVMSELVKTDIKVTFKS